MSKNRLEAFSDGVLAILITIMVLELKVPAAAGWAALQPTLVTLGCYVVSFAYLAIYWGNHHHLFHTVTRVNGKIIWANTHLLFWLSLVPFATSWVGTSNFGSVPVAGYGVILLMCAVAFTILAKLIVKYTPEQTKFSEAFHKTNMKATLTTALYIAAVPLAFAEPLVSCGIFIFTAFLWMVPNKQIEKLLEEEGEEKLKA